jgi:uncharacterized protein with HEPN domain
LFCGRPSSGSSRSSAKRSRKLARIDAAMAQKVPDLRQIIAFRNVLIHGYATVDPARVWRVIEDNLPPLRAALAELLAAPE